MSTDTQTEDSVQSQPVSGGLRVLRTTLLVFDGLFIAGFLILMGLFFSSRSLSPDAITSIALSFIALGVIFVAFSIPYLATSVIYLIQWGRKISGQARFNPATTALRVLAPLLVVSFDLWSIYMLVRS